MQFRLLALLGLVTLGVAAGAAPGDLDDLGSGYHALELEYEAELTSWEAKKSVSDRAGRKELQAHHPARAFWARFQTAADGGEGRALLWQCQNVRVSELGLKARKALINDNLTALFRSHAAEPWMEETLELAVKGSNLRVLGEENVERGLRGVIAKNEHANAHAAALVHLGKLLTGSEDPARREEGLRLYERCVAEHAGSGWAETADERAFTLRHLSRGSEALDFQGTTIDGETFRLSDHRGKVVVLDFFGFW